jgi:hypothetical protein
MRIFDVILQGILLLVGIISATQGTNGLIFLLLAQAAIGALQVLSAIVNTIFIRRLSPSNQRLIIVYWAAVVVYFVAGTLVYQIKTTEVMFTWLFTAWLIAIYYFIVCIRSLRQERRKTFLDIMNQN